MQRLGRHFSAGDRVIAVALTVVWIGASLTAILLGFSGRHWTVGLIGIFGLGYGLLWLKAAYVGRRLRWKEVFWPRKRR